MTRNLILLSRIPVSHIAILLWRTLGHLLERRNLAVLAELCFRKAIDLAPARDTGSRFRLARLLIAQKRYADALSVLEAAASGVPQSAEIWNALGVARRENFDMEGAGEAFKHALTLNPKLIDAYNNFGNWLLATGDARQALSWFDKALENKPDFYETLNNRIVALLDLGSSVEAEKCAKRALEQYPNSAPIYLNLGNSYLQQGERFQAVKAFKKALEIDPTFEEAHFNHALLDGTAEHLGKAINFLRKQIHMRGRTVDLLSRLAAAHTANQSYGEAEATCREILEKNPGFVPAYISLGLALSGMGESGEALDWYQKALRGMPEDSRIHSNYLFELNYLPAYSKEFVFDKHMEWANKHDRSTAIDVMPKMRSKDENRRLRVGYVSPDFCSHPVGHLIRGVLSHHDKKNFEIHCFSRVAKSDAITEECQRNTEVWHDTLGASDTEVVKLVVDREIDILIDLSGHTGGHRLAVFSEKPSPVQATWIGYFHSTGMRSIDYFITDPYTSPKGSGQLFAETPVYLPHTRFCYTPPEYAPPVTDAPVLKNDYVTLGCFNKLSKMTDEVMQVWIEIMRRLPDARLWLKNVALKDPALCDRLRARFAALGGSPERLILKPASPHLDMLNEYGEIDIALDPFPYTGGMTTFEALLMGVPLVTLAGQRVVARQSASVLINLGLREFVCETVDDYVECAVKLASDRERLVELRGHLRPMMEQSPLCDIQAFTKDVEGLYRRMWHAWCDGKKLPSDVAR